MSFQVCSLRGGSDGCGTPSRPLGLRLRAAEPRIVIDTGATVGCTRDTAIGRRGATVGATGRPGAPVWAQVAFSFSMRESNTAEGLRQLNMSDLMSSACISGLKAWFLKLLFWEASWCNGKEKQLAVYRGPRPSYLSRFGGLTQLMKQREVDLTLPLIWWNQWSSWKQWSLEIHRVPPFDDCVYIATAMTGQSVWKYSQAFKGLLLNITNTVWWQPEIRDQLTSLGTGSWNPIIYNGFFAPSKRWFSRRICWTIDSSLNLYIPPNGKNKNHLKKTSPWEKDMLLPRRISIFVHGIPWLSPHLQCCSCRSIHLVSGHVVLENSWKNPGSFRGNKHDLYIPRSQMTPIFEGQPSKRRPFPIKTAGFQVYIPLKVNGWFI